MPSERIRTDLALQPSRLRRLRCSPVAFAGGVVAVDSFRAVRDGGYSTTSTTSTVFIAGTGTFGLALGAESQAGSAIGSARREAQAQDDAMVRCPQRPQLSGG